MDIDIDFRPDFKVTPVFPQFVKASIVKNDVLTPHPCGAYPQSIATDPITKLAAVPYEMAENLGFMKIDFLHNSVYKHFSSHEEIEELIKIEPNWNLLLIPSVVERLFQLGRHSDVLAMVKPKSINDLADVLAIIRPGKRVLLDAYLSNKETTRRILYSASNGEYSFKKSHAIAYSLVVVLQLHLVEAGIPLE